MTTSAESSVEVDVDPATAFAIFTEEINLWWVRGPINHYDASRLAELRLEPGIGGRVLEIYDEAAGDVSARETVTVWEPGSRLVLSGDTMEVDIRFTESASGTRVDVSQYLLPDGDPQRAGFGWVNMLYTYDAWIVRRRTASREPREVDRLGVALHYRDPHAGARWLRDVFQLGDWDVDHVPEPEDLLQWFELHAGNSLIMVFPGEEVRQTTWVFVDDLEAHYAHAKEAGAKIISAIATHGSRSYEAEDPEGHRWTFVQARPTMRIGPGPVDDLAAAAATGIEKATATLLPRVDPQQAGLLLHRFATDDDQSALNALVAAGVEVNTVDEGGATALHHAAGAGHLAAAEILINAGADLDRRDGQHASSPVLWARVFGHTDMIKLLLDRGARLNAADAAKLGLNRIVSGFLDDLPEVIDQPVGWPTPLAAAISADQPETVRLLLDRGADPNAPTGYGDTPLDCLQWAGEDSAAAMRQLLKDHGAIAP